MKRKKIIITGGIIITAVIILVILILKGKEKTDNKIERKTEILKTEKKSDKEIAKEIKKMEEQVNILAEEQKNRQIKQEEILKEYEAKIYKEIDKNRRILLIKEMVDIVGVHGIDASAIPKLDEIKNRINDSDEKKIITEKIKMILRNRDMFAELEEYEKYNQ